jgi:hypothetical protein
MNGGSRVAYWGLGEHTGCFEGRLLNPRPIDIQNGGDVSDLWLLSEVRWMSQPGRSNAFRRHSDGRLDREFLRHSAVRRLYERGRITDERAIELLTCKPTLRRVVVNSWTQRASQ